MGAADVLASPERPGDSAERMALARVLASDAFRGAPKLSAFLSFIVERELAGRGSELKGYTIAVEALGRGPEFDPQADPIVRVEAGRLRKALAHYYAVEGAGDPLRIAIPLGAYVPQFQPAEAPASVLGPDQDAASAPAEPAPPPIPAVSAGSGRSRLNGLRAMVLGAFILGAAVASVSLWLVDDEAPAKGDGAAAPARVAAGGTAGRTLPSAAGRAKLPVLAIASEPQDDPSLIEIEKSFTRQFVDTLARFDDIVAVRIQTGGQPAHDDPDYVFEISVERSGDAINGAGRLRTSSGRVVWTTTLSRAWTDRTSDAELAELAQGLAVRLAEPYGVIRADARQNAPSWMVRCIFLAQEFRRAITAGSHREAHECLDELLRQDPDFHPAWSHLAVLTLLEHSANLNPRPGPALDRALTAAMTAVRLAPSSARAHKSLMSALFARGQVTEALAAGQEALSRNPYDPDIMANLGARYVMMNRPAEGMPLLQRAIQLSAGRPPWYDFFAFLGACLQGDMKLAEPYLAGLTGDQNSLSLLAVAMHASQANDAAAAMAAVDALIRREPEVQSDPVTFLARKGFGPEVSSRIFEVLGPLVMQRLKPR